MFGLLAYPAQGVHKSIQAGKGRQAAVTKSKQRLLVWEAASGSAESDSTKIWDEYDVPSREVQGTASD